MRIVSWFSVIVTIAALASLLSGYDRILLPLIGCVGAALYYLHYRQRWGPSK